MNKRELPNLAKEILKLRPGIVALEGPLGAGKTALTKVLARELGIKDEIVSPTFVLLRQYGNLNHIDCWRMESGEELEQLGFEKMLDSRSLIVVEWADRVRETVLKYKNKAIIVWVKLEYGKKENERRISYENISR